MTRGRTVLSCIGLTILLSGCSDGPPPAGPSGPSSFLTGTWRGTVTVQGLPGAVDSFPAATGAIAWTFEVVPQTNLQTFRATIHSENPWLPFDTLATTAVSPTNTPPTQISTQGDYSSPRGCRGTFGSVGTADATHIDADFTGVDCLTTFTGRMSLTKQ